MNRRILTSIIAFITLWTVAPASAAQATAQPETYRWDLGAGIGMSGYLGDANESNLLSHPDVAGNISLRYLINTRFAVRALVNMASISGSTADMENVVPGTTVRDFRSTVYDLQARGEFNFFNYGIGQSYKQLSRVSPYLALGAGLSVASCRGGESNVAMTIPMAVGVKYKANPRLNLGLEFAMNKVLGDKADGRDLTDLYLIKSSFIKNTDWYSTLLFSVSYELGERCIGCNRLD